MPAAAAARAHPMDQRSKPDKVPLPKWFIDSLDRDGFMVVPITAIENLDRKLDPAARSVYLNLLRLTVGNFQQGRPQKVRVTREEFAEWAKVSPRQISNALAFLRDNEVIGCSDDESNAKYVLFWITDFTLSRLPDLNLREVNRETKPAPPSGKPVLLSNGGRWKSRFDQPATIEEISYRHEGDDLEVRQEIHGSTLELITKTRSNGANELRKDDGTRVPSKGRKRAVEADALPPLEAFLDPVFLDLFHHAPDAALLKRIKAALKDTPAPYYVHGIVLPRVRKSRRGIETGLFVNLAEEARAKWAKLPPEVRQRFLPAAPDRPMPAYLPLYEPEDSGSPWMQIRLAMKVSIPPTDYGNWLATTAFVALKHGELVVGTPDEVTAQFIEQEWSAKIMELARTLGLAVDRVRWLPPEGS